MAETQSNIQANPKQSSIGMNLNSVPSQIREGMVSYALNAVVQNFDGNQVAYQNESANVLCTTLPDGFRVVGQKNIIEDGIKLFWLLNPETDEHQIGKVVDCTFTTIISDPCLNFNIDYPILKIVYRKNECGELEVYWVDALNRTRYLNLSDLPYKTIEGKDPCDDIITEEIDCNKLNLQPDFSIPLIQVTAIDSDADLTAGTYQFAVQYADGRGEAYTSYYTVTNPTPIFDPTKITLDFNYQVGKSIVLKITNLDDTGLYDYINLAVIKTVNNISTVELVATLDIIDGTINYTYSGQSKTDIKLSTEDIFAKYDVYDTAGDITVAQDTLVLADLTTHQRISYQSIANRIKLYWQTWRMPKDRYEDPVVSTYLKGYMGDEVYPFEIVFLLKNGVQTDGFHIPGRTALPFDLDVISNNDVVDTVSEPCAPQNLEGPRWQVYNTASVLGYEQVYLDFLEGITPPEECDESKSIEPCGIINIDPSQPECYSGPFQYGEFAYWESTDLYPCNDIYGELQNQPIRHHRFPDSLVSHIHDNEGFIYPKGVRFDIQQIINIINNSDLSDDEKSQIQGFKIVRGNRANNKSVVAKGLLYNVGKYNKDEKGWYYPNYPFNDLREDPFITTETNYIDPEETPTGTGQCFSYTITPTSPTTTITYINCNTGLSTQYVTSSPDVVQLCALQTPVITAGTALISAIVTSCEEGDNNTVVNDEGALNGFGTDASKKRYTFHSPDTHFYQPSLGNILKLETAEFGKAESHFVEVKNHAKYAFLSSGSVVASLAVAVGIGFASSTIGVSTNVFNGTAAWTALQTMLNIIEKLLPNKNFAYQQNAVGEYDKYLNVLNAGNKQRRVDLALYLQPGIANVGDDNTINNYQRESSVYLKTQKILPFVSDIVGVPEDNTRYTLSQEGTCSTPNKISEKDISAYYSAIKKGNGNQYGQLYSYQTVDTGFQFNIDLTNEYPTEDTIKSVFGGDIFISRFALKRKYPFFLDNRVSPDGTNMFANNSDIEYNELGNIGYPKYWFSTDIRQSGGGVFFGLFGVKDTAFDCKENKFFYQSGKIYLFSYGIPYYYCESEVNVDLRQAFNDKEGDFFPRVGSGIPDDWLQETYVTINYDNTYYYNKTYSKQNKENLFTHLPNDWTNDECTTTYPFRAVFSEDWILFKPSAKFDFPQNYGELISIDGIENKQVLARFEQKPLLYNALLTAPTSQSDVYLGQSIFNQSVPPLDYADTDLGYIGCQNKFFLKTKFGHVTVDTARGEIFLIRGNGAENITEDNEYRQVSKFFREFLPFQILSVSKDINVDNHYKDIGITGVLDFNRLIITKKDFKPLYSDITYLDGKFYRGSEEVELTDTRYFCNYSFTVSYDLRYGAWVSFHTYIPLYYIGDVTSFDVGIQGSLWTHEVDQTRFNNFFGEIAPYIIESPYSRAFNDEILQNIKDYSRIFKYTNWQEFIETDVDYFNKMIIYSNQQCSGLLELVSKPRNNLQDYNKYPMYNSDSKTITFAKSGSFYQINTFWDMVVDVKQPIWLKSCENLSIFKEINQDNMDYGKRSRKKSPFRSKELKIRYILDDKDDVKIISSFTVAPTAISYK